MKFRKKPVVIEAIQWTGKNLEEVLSFAKTNQIENDFIENWIQIPTLEGTMKAMPGYWIIRGVKQELYPCKPDIFEATYERVEG
jgi:hypothetical protein